MSEEFMERFYALGTLYYDAIIDDPFEENQQTREYHEKLMAMYNEIDNAGIDIFEI